MARIQVLESVCDRCHKQEDTPYGVKPLRALYELPEGWLHVQANTRTALAFAMDLCDECKDTVLKAAGRFKEL